MTKKKMKYVLAKSSPWVVLIDGQRFVVQSTVARLLLQLAGEKEKGK